MEHFFKGIASLRHWFMSWRRSALNEVNDWGPNSNKETLTFVNFCFSMASDCENRSAAKKRREKIDSERPIQIQEMFATTDDLNQFESEICLQMRNLSMWRVWNFDGVDSYSEIFKKIYYFVSPHDRTHFRNLRFEINKNVYSIFP